MLPWATSPISAAMVAVIVRTGSKKHADSQFRDVRSITGDHHHSHRLANGAANPQHYGDYQPGARGRQHDTPDGLPVGSAHRQRPVTVFFRDRIKGVFGDANHRRQGHVSQNERCGEGRQSSGGPGLLNERGQNNPAQKSQHNRRNTG